MKRILSLIAILVMIALNCASVYGAQSVSVPVDIEIQGSDSGQVRIQGNGVDETINVSGSTTYYFAHDAVGEYYYTVKQLPGTDTSIEYDNTEFTVYVNVYYPPEDSSIDPHTDADYTPNFDKLAAYVIIKKPGDNSKPDKICFTSKKKDTDDPDDPDDPDDSSETDTGDSTIVAVWLICLAASLWAFIIITWRRDKKERLEQAKK